MKDVKSILLQIEQTNKFPKEDLITLMKYFQEYKTRFNQKDDKNKEEIHINNRFDRIIKCLKDKLMKI